MFGNKFIDKRSLSVSEILAPLIPIIITPGAIPELACPQFSRSDEDKNARTPKFNDKVPVVSSKKEIVD